MKLDTIKEQVKWVYEIHEKAKECDKILLEKWEHAFGDTRYKEGTIKRAGRSIRNQEGHIRDPVKLQSDNEFKQEIINTFAR
tara:strand:- start:605 stop:850 length:246 start_codon:yes stop_codon:yes gene_type:complete